MHSSSSNMTPRVAVPPGHGSDWRWQVAQSRIDEEALIERFGVPAAARGAYRELLETFPCRITPYYESLMADPEDPGDPIRLQGVPALQEADSGGACRPDPFDEAGHMPVPGIIHRYPDRLVLLVSDACAVNCRHCTRRNLLGDGISVQGKVGLEQALSYIDQSTDVREVLVSGGDPLLNDTPWIAGLLARLHAIDHLEVLRLGTRVPVTCPMRIDDELCDALAACRPLWVNTQFNHPVELTVEAMGACDRLLRVGIPVSNQSVLLKGVNDDIDTMRALCAGLQAHMVRPYYVFQCDPVAGVGHFVTDPAVGVQIEDALRVSLGGLAVPRFVADLPDSESKTPLYRLSEERDDARQ